MSAQSFLVIVGAPLDFPRTFSVQKDGDGMQSFIIDGFDESDDIAVLLVSSVG